MPSAMPSSTMLRGEQARLLAGACKWFQEGLKQEMAECALS